MSNIARYVFISTLLIASLAAYASPASQPTVWAAKPDATAFEKIVNERLAEGQKSIDKMLAVKGPRTIENTLVPFDEAFREISTGNYLASLMFQVHPDAAFRDPFARRLAGERGESL